MGKKTLTLKTPHADALEELAKKRLDETTGPDETTLRQVLEKADALYDPEAVEEEGEDSGTPIGPKRVVEAEEQPPPTPKDPEPRGEDLEPPAEPIEGAEAPRDASRPYQKDGKWFVSLKIDGVQTEMPLEELQRSAQKDAASAARFREVAERELLLRAREEQLALREQNIAARIIQGTGSTNRPAPAQLDPGKVYDELFYMDEEEAKARLAEILQGAPTTQAATQDAPVGRDPVSTPDITAVVDERLRQQLAEDRERQFEADRLAALEQFKVDYSDVWADPRMKQIAGMRTIELRDAALNSGLPVDPRAIMDEAGKFAREWRHVEQMRATGQANSGLDERLQRKQSIPTPVSGSGQRAPVEPEGFRGSTLTETLDQMRKARGQSVM